MTTKPEPLTPSPDAQAARLIEAVRDEVDRPPLVSQSKADYDRGYCAGINACRRAILALLVAAGQRQE